MSKTQKEADFSIHNNTKKVVPPLPFKKIKDAVLGNKYCLSVVFVGDKLSEKLNKNYRDKDRPTDVLSFPLEKNEGEIFINLKEVQRKAPGFNKSFKNYLGFVFIHGLLHLKGMDHSSRMESEERKFCRTFGF